MINVAMKKILENLSSYISQCVCVTNHSLHDFWLFLVETSPVCVQFSKFQKYVLKEI